MGSKYKKTLALMLLASGVMAAGEVGATAKAAKSETKGVVGPAGPQGPVGATGPAGPQGPIGQQGPQGPIGATGATGLPQAGNNVGDMQYWDGTTWAMISAGANNTVLRNCDGVPSWVVDHCGFSIGDTGPAGGIVFYLIDDGTYKHGLEAAPIDQSSGIVWGCDGTTVAGTDTALGSGKANTIIINAQCGIGTAAQAAASYSLNGFSDWFLPSMEELNIMYNSIGQSSPNFGGLSHVYYWTSSETDPSIAWIGYALNPPSRGNFASNGSKIWELAVRAIRSF